MIDSLGGRKFAALGGDEHAEVEHYRHEGGLHGRRWALILASMSWTRSSSMTAFDPRAFRSATILEIIRPTAFDP
jgi:hypothetical protein